MATLTEEQKAARREARMVAQREQEGRRARREAIVQARYVQSYRRYREWEATEDRLRSLVPRALEVLERTLSEEADPKPALSAALSVLRAAGLNGLERPSRPSRYRLELEEVDTDLEDVEPEVAEATG